MRGPFTHPNRPGPAVYRGGTRRISAYTRRVLGEQACLAQVGQRPCPTPTAKGEAYCVNHGPKS